MYSNSIHAGPASTQKTITPEQATLNSKAYQPTVSSCPSMIDIHHRLMDQISHLPSVDLSCVQSIPEPNFCEPQPFFDRSKLTAQDHEVLNQLFYVTLDTETPSRQAIQDVRSFYEARFPQYPAQHLDKTEQQAQAFYELRHVAKKGKYLNGNAIEGDSNLIAKTTPAGQQLRAEAGLEVVEHPLPQQRSEREYQAFFNEITSRVHTIIDNNPNAFPKDQAIQISVRRPSKDLNAHDLTMNYLAQGFQASLTDTLNGIAQRTSSQTLHLEFKDNQIFTTLCRTSRAEANPIGRLGQLGYFSSKNIKPNELIIIADDHIQSGDAIISCYLAAKEAGAHVIGVGAFGIHPFSAGGLFNTEQQQQVSDLLGEKDPEQQVAETLKSIGIPMSQLNIFEGMILKAMFEDSSGDSLEHQNIEQNRHPILPSAHDDLHSLRQAPAPSPEAFTAALEQEINTNRRVIAEI